jgi:chemotaxis protein methyltransferase CheR
MMQALKDTKMIRMLARNNGIKGENTDKFVFETETNLSDAVFKKFSTFIISETGIKMPVSKKTMLQARLQKRMRKLKIKNYEQYYDYVLGAGNGADERIHMIDVVTTNKTEFFRESKHFNILTDSVLPELIEKKGAGNRRPLSAWSAGCSTGAEVYTLAMVLSDFAEKVKGFKFKILGTDICTQVLEKARLGIYDEKEADDIPMPMKKKYLLRSKDKSQPKIRIVPELRKPVEFRRLNFMIDDFGLRTVMDIAFCRNVIIYFDRPTQEAVLGRICRYLSPGGYLFTGHSETLNGYNLPLRQVGASVYQKT